VLTDGTLDPRPLLRGVSHQYALFASLVAGGALVALAPDARARLASGVYALSLATLFGSSAIYHRKWWPTRRARNWMRRLDHSAIFLLIAGTYTPFGLLALEGRLADAVLVSVWGGAILGMLLYVVWIDSPRWLTPIAYLAVGWAGIASLPQMFDQAAVHDGRADLRAKMARPGAHGVRLSRALSRARRRCRGNAVRRGCARRPLNAIS
jgi:hemolysin III